MKVSIITVNFNQPEVTLALLQSIPVNSGTEVIVVDNGSKTDSSALLSAKFQHIKAIRSEVNLGFAGGNNLGINAATGEYLFLVNNDTEFTTGLVEELVDVLDKNPKVGMVSPLIKYFDQPELIQYAGYTPINYFTCRNSCIGLKQADKGQFDNITGITAYCHGAAMMVRRTAVEKAGLMNEGFFLYYEEVDWCEHIKRAGYQAWVNTRALIFHKESVSVGKKSRLKTYFMNRNRMLFIRRNAPFFKMIIFYFYYCLVVVPRDMLVFIKEKNYGFISVLLKAAWWNFTHSKNSTNLGYQIHQIQ